MEDKYFCGLCLVEHDLGTIKGGMHIEYKFNIDELN